MNSFDQIDSTFTDCKALVTYLPVVSLHLFITPH